MAEQEQPRLVKKDGERMTPEQAPVTAGNMLEMFKLMLEQQAVGTATTLQANAEMHAAQKLAIENLKDDLKKGEYNIANFPNVSAFNPKGENAAVGGTPRTELQGEIAWAGYPLRTNELLEPEILLLNQLQPGIYHDGLWIVQDRAPGVKGQRKLLVIFPCTTQDERSSLPSGYRDVKAGRDVSGMELMLQEMVDEAARRQPVSA